MRRALTWALGLAALISVVFPAKAQVESKDALALRLFPAALVRKHVSVTAALSEIGARVQGGYVLFGIEMRLKEDQVPIVDLNLPAQTTVGGALGQILGQLKNYRLEVVSGHLINVYPLGAKQDAQDLLNLRISRLDVSDVPPDTLLTIPQMFIPELMAKLRRPGETGILGNILSGVGPGITLHLREVTIRDILNAASEATEHLPEAAGDPIGWLCVVRADPTETGGWAYSWELQTSVPHDWKKQSLDRRMGDPN